jgi:short/branched chain acyl-CoA dehydrogenase
VDFDLSPDHELIRRTVREFAEGEVAPVAEHLDRTKSFPYEIVAQLGKLNLMGIPFPEEYGGGGGDTLAYALAVEELTRVDSSVAITLCAHTSLGTQPIYVFGSDEQKREWMPQLCSGERLGAFGLTEPEAGSDAGNTRTKARLRGWRVGDRRRQAIHHQRRHRHLRRGLHHRGHRCPKRGFQGDIQSNHPQRHARLRAGRAVPQDGLERVRHTPLSFSDCRVPEESLLGPRGAGFKQFLHILDIGRIGVAAMGVGLAQGALDEALKYAKERKAFGKPISKFQAIQGKLADMSTEIAAARLLVYKAAREKDAKRNFYSHGCPGEAEDRPPGGPLCRGGGADPRRLRLHRGVPRVPLLPRREDPHDRRGHRRGPADGDCASARRVSRDSAEHRVDYANLRNA